MSYADWQERYAMGIPTVDREHKILFDLIGQLHDGYAARRTTPDLQRVFDVLMEYIGEHFAHEAKVFEEYGYPGAAAHVKSHEKFRAEVETLFKRYLAGEGEMVCIELIALLNNWWHFHVLEDDAAYGRYIAAQSGQGKD